MPVCHQPKLGKAHIPRASVSEVVAMPLIMGFMPLICAPIGSMVSWPHCHPSVDHRKLSLQRLRLKRQ